MIICPECSSELAIRPGQELSACPHCGYKLSSPDHTLVFHPHLSGVHPGMQPEIYGDVISAEEKHFWMASRRNVILSLFKRYVRESAEIIEIGAGTGNIAKFLFEKGYKKFAAGDVHLEALDQAKRYGIQNRYQFDLIHPPFLEHFDVICLFDVLEHIDDEDAAARSIFKMLKPGGRVLVTVPAYMWLWSRQDAIASHRRRYRLEELKSIFSRNQFKILQARYFFMSLVPFLFVRSIFDKDDGNLEPLDFKKRFRINPAVNFVFAKMLSLENRLLRDRPFKWGGSILLVAEK